MNSWNGIGRLTRDPEPQGEKEKKRARFSLAVNRPGKDKGADFIDCVAFGKTAELITDHLKKGSQIGIEGRIQTSIYDRDGETRKSFSILVERMEFLGSKPKDMTDDVVDFFTQGGE